MEQSKHIPGEEHKDSEADEDNGSGSISGSIDSLVGVETPFGRITGVVIRPISPDIIIEAGVGDETHWHSEGGTLPGQPGPGQ